MTPEQIAFYGVDPEQLHLRDALHGYGSVDEYAAAWESGECTE